MVWLCWVVLGLLAAHDVTHVLDDGLETPLGLFVLVAVPQWLFLAVAMTVVVRGDADHARTAALLIGGSVTIGFAAVHLLPGSPAAFWDVSPSGISWVLAWATVLAALALALLAARRQQALDSRSAAP
jgi:hypothetical protein